MRLDLTFLGMRLSGAIHKRNGHGTNGHFYLEKILVQVRIRRCMTRRKSGFFDSVIHKKSPFGSPFFVISYSKVFSRIGLFGRCKPVFLAWLDDFEVSIVTCLTHRNRDYSTPTIFLGKAWLEERHGKGTFFYRGSMAIPFMDSLRIVLLFCCPWRIFPSLDILQHVMVPRSPIRLLFYI